jgi:hypothetical protein
MLFVKTIILVALIAVKLTDCIKTNKYNDFESSQRTERRHKIKQVHYAVKGTINPIEIKTISVKNVDIDPFVNTNIKWMAKAIWDGSNYNETGWSLLEIETNKDASNFDQAFALGVLEGQLTRDQISLHLRNNVGDFCMKQNAKTAECIKLKDFLQKNLEWMNDQIVNNQNDPYWHHVNLIWKQFFGLYHGYNNLTTSSSANSKYDHMESMIKDVDAYFNLLVLQMNGDMDELMASLNNIENRFMGGSCSALIKLLPDNSDLFVSHDTWTVFESMLRILKHYKLNYRLTSNPNEGARIPGSEISFSSYPGIMSSIDDFNILNSKLVVQETTIGNANTTLWQHVTPQTNLYWIRNQVANRLAFTGPDWAKIFAEWNSGTYNNQWMIVDMKEFFPGVTPLRPGLLTILEQVPGNIMIADKTYVLEDQTYWSSYNIAYFPEIYNISGTFESYLEYGDFFSYEKTPRAQIFSRDHSNVKDIDSMIKMMRYNDYTRDPLSECPKCTPPYSAENTIAARSDLNPASGSYPFASLGHRDHGATDMKLTTWKMSRDLEFIAFAGPTYDENEAKRIPPFCWSTSDFGNTTNHFGLADCWAHEPLHIIWSMK